MASGAPESADEQAPAPGFRAGFVGLLGRPNVGKSTLLNALVGQKLAAVTRKPQTTRTRISGILTTDDTQFVFLDTPGIVEPRYRLQEHMVRSAFAAAKSADVLLYMIDVTRAPHPADAKILERLGSVRAPLFLVPNKVDRINKPLLLPLLEHYSRGDHFVEYVPISSKRGTGLADLRAAIRGYLPQCPAMFPVEQVSDLPERFFVAEAVREKVFLKTRQEVPYASSVVVEEYIADPGASRLYIRVAIYVERQSQKAIVIGTGGSMLREIGRAGRKEIEAFVDGPVFLELFVGVREDWRERDNYIREFGYGG